MSELRFTQSREFFLCGTHRAICYSGFRQGQHPDRGDGAVYPSYEETLEDLRILSRDNLFTLIRLYDSGPNSEMVLRVIREHNIPIKVLLGMWLHAEINSHGSCVWLKEPYSNSVLESNRKKNADELNRGIRLANGYSDIVCGVNVGNESLVDWNDHLVRVSSVIEYVKHLKDNITQPVTVAENYQWWADHGADLANVVDFVSVHSYPVWLGHGIDEGMEITRKEVQLVADALPGKQIVITEAGWATLAEEFGERASEENQARYSLELLEWAEETGVTVFLFEAFDEPWKGNPVKPDGAEKHWGIFTVDREPKLAAVRIMGC